MSDAQHPIGPKTTAAESQAAEPLAIVGIGCLFPGADSLDAYWANIRAGVDCITEVPPTHWSTKDYFATDPSAPDMTYARRGGFLDAYPFDPLRYGISPNNLEATDASQLLGLVVAEQALRDAGYATSRDATDGRPFDRDRTSVILGVTGTLQLVIPLGARLGHPLWRKALAEAGVAKEVADDVVQRIADGYVPWQENSFPGLLGNVAAGRIANRFDLGGTNCVVDAACASSLSALHMAAMELHARRADMVLTGGFDTFNDIFMYMCFSKTPALSPTGDSRPFAADADGTILGEGLGMVALKRLADARRDGDRIYAVVRGIGSSSDGRGNAIYAPSSTGQMKALRAAYRAAGVSPKSVELVEAHGTGTKVGDLTETTSLAEVFRQDGGAGTWCAVGSVKSMIGHTKAAAGVAGLIKTALALSDKVLPPTLKVAAPLEPLLAGNSPAYANTLARPWVAPVDHPRRAALSAFGFGGSNFHCVLEEAEPARSEVRWDGRVQILAFRGSTPAEIDSQLASFNAATSWKELRSLAAATRSSFDAAKRCRLAIVVEKGGDLARSIATARRTLAAKGDAPTTVSLHWSTPDGVHFASGPTPGKLAVLFPGQGSQYVYMQRELACQFPQMLAEVDAANRAFGRSEHGQRLSDIIFPPPVFTDADRAAQQDHLRRTEFAQPALGAVSLGAWRLLESFGISADAFAGHSFGELVALCAAGRIGEQDLVRLSVERGRLMAAGAGDRGSMLAVAATVDDVRRTVNDAALDLTIANHNGPTQVVLSGATAEIDRAADRFAALGVRTVKLPVAAAFHSPLVADAQAEFAVVLDRVEFRPATKPVLANTTGDVYPDAIAAARDLLAAQLARPVEFVREIESLYAQGVRTFLEVGPQAKLVGLVRSILADRPHAAVSIDATSGRRSGQFDLASALAELAILDHTVDLPGWDPQPAENATAAKKPGLIVPLTGANYIKPRPPRPPRIASASVRLAEPLEKSAQDSAQHRPIPAPRTVESIYPAAQAPKSPPQSPPKLIAAEPRHRDEVNPAPTTPPPANSSPAIPPRPARPSPRQRTDMELDQALRLNEQSILALERMQEQTAQLHRQYLEGQLTSQRTVEQLVEQQQWLLAAAFGAQANAPANAPPPFVPPPQTAVAAVDRQPPPTATTSLPPRAAPPIAHPIPTPSTVDALANAAVPVTHLPPPAPSPSIPSASSVSSAVKAPPSTAQSNTDLSATLLEIVADKTGYPVETLDLDMSLDADLGIDSIKRVEIMSAVQERLPDAPAVRPDDLGRLQTLRQIVAFLSTHSFAPAAQTPPPLASPTPFPSANSASSASCVANKPSPPTPDFASTLLEVVADKTGYPVETLELDMSLDADLGIDSIKRVEILSALQERMPDAPTVRPDDLGRLQTLRQIVAFLDQSSAASSPATTGTVVNPRLPAASPSAAIPPARNDTAALPSTVSPIRVAAPAPVIRNIIRPAEPSAQPSAELIRRVLRPVPVPGSRQPIALDRAAEFWIADDGGELAEALRRQLIARRIVARVVPLDAVLVDHPVCGLCVLAPDSIGQSTSSSSGETKRRPTKRDAAVHDTNRFIADAFRIIQRVGPGLRETGRTSAAVLATVSRLDGRFGLGDRLPSDPVSGALAGLTKTAALEWPEVQAKAIDVDDALSVESLAERIADELLAAGPVEIGITAAGSIALELVDELAAGHNESLSRQPLASGDIVVVSGGARGVAAEAAVAMAAKYGCTMLLLGRSPEPTPEPDWAAGLSSDVEIKRTIVAQHGGPLAPKAVEFQCRRLLAGREIVRTIARIESAGGRAMYRSLDVRDAAALRSVLAEARQHTGPIRGVVHAAGVLADRLIEDKTDEQFAEVWSTKVAGATALLEATASDDLAALAFFSSSTARFGRKGQIDYAAANEALNKLAGREARRRPNCRVVSFNWGPWDGGMVTPQLKKLFAAEGVGVIDLQAGANYFADELAAPPSAAVEIVVLGPHPTSATPSGPATIAAEKSAAEKSGTEKSTAVTPSETKPAARMYTAFERELSVETCPVLRSHVINGRAVLPMALMVEWLAHAALHDNPGLQFVGLDDLRVFKGVILESDSHVTLRAMASAPEAHEGAEVVQVELHAGNTLHARARVVLGSDLATATPSLAPPRGNPLADPNVYDGVRLFHGPQLHGVVAVESCGPDGIFAQACTAPHPSEWIEQPLRGGWLADPLALDAAFQLMIVWCFEQRGIGSLPTRFARYRQFVRTFPEGELSIAIRIDRQGPHHAEATIQFCDPAGRLIARIEGYECVLDASLGEAFARNELAAHVG
ncbi:MAG: SDR family NAD(P)-dependent oxidoreductase [Pirellulales bacterium]